MIKECILAKTGIQFDMDYLKHELEFDLEETKGMNNNQGIAQNAQENEALRADTKSTVSNGTAETHSHHWADILDKVFDQLALFWWFWWILELIPMLTTYQDPQGNWIRLRM